MLKVEDNDIYLTRGDSAQFNIDIVDDNGDVYELEEGDKCEFTVKKRTSSEEVLIKKEIIDSTFKINPEDTSHLNFGDYIYDVQVTLANGDIYTIIIPSLFKVLEEVNFE